MDEFTISNDPSKRLGWTYMFPQHMVLGISIRVHTTWQPSGTADSIYQVDQGFVTKIVSDELVVLDHTKGVYTTPRAGMESVLIETFGPVDQSHLN